MVAVPWVPKWKILANAVAVPKPVAALREISRVGEISHDRGDRSVRDADLVGDVSQPGSRVRAQVGEHVRVVGYEPEAMVA